MGARILIADDMDLVTHAIRATLERTSAWAVIGECHALDEVQFTLQQQRIDVLICGQQLDPALDALSLLDQLRRLSNGARIVMIGAPPDGFLIANLLVCGLHGYLYRSDPLRDCLPVAVETALRNHPYLSPTAEAEYRVTLQSGRRTRLSGDERAVLRMLAQGQRVIEIARTLDLPPRRVYGIREKLRRRFGATTNEHLITRAASEGFQYSDE